MGFSILYLQGVDKHVQVCVHACALLSFLFDYFRLSIRPHNMLRST